MIDAGSPPLMIPVDCPPSPSGYAPSEHRIVRAGMCVFVFLLTEAASLNTYSQAQGLGLVSINACRYRQCQHTTRLLSRE